jgi:HTH-type transcriptional regulator/antitoxin MqsA
MVTFNVVSEYGLKPPTEFGRFKIAGGPLYDLALDREIEMESKALCPICGEGQVSSHMEWVDAEYKGQTKALPSHYRECDACHSDFAGAPESKVNKRAIMAFRKSVDGLLTGAEICAVRDQYKLTQGQAARLFGGGPVAFSKYENDDVSQSESMDTLLRLVRRSPEAFWCLVDEKQMQAEFATQRRTVRVSPTSNVYPLQSKQEPVTHAPPKFHRYEPEAQLWK